MTSSHGAAKFTAGTLLVVIVLANLAFLVFEMVDLNQATLVFGTGPYYISLMAILGGLLVLWWLAVIWDYTSISQKNLTEKARFWWPRFSWDFWGFNIAAVIGVGTIIGILSAFIIKYGQGAVPDLGSLLPMDEESDRWSANTIFTIVSTFLVMIYGIDLLFSYVLREKFYVLRPISDLVPPEGGSLTLEGEEYKEF